MELTVTTMMSLDGVTQSPGGAEEDPSGGFELGGWAMPFFEEEAKAHVDAIFGRADAFLFGRKTYDIFASYWPGVGDDDPVAAALNARPKHVVSSTRPYLGWGGASLLEGDLVEAVTALKESPGRELQVHGSVELTQFLMAAGLVDRHHLTVIPVVLRGGRGLFAGVVPPTTFRVETATTTRTGVQLLTLVADGDVVQGHF